MDVDQDCILKPIQSHSTGHHENKTVILKGDYECTQIFKTSFTKEMIPYSHSYTDSVEINK